jgi:hypothetical protein
MLKKAELDALGELLQLACADDNQQAREDLQHALDWAYECSKFEGAPPRVHKKIEITASKLKAAIAELEHYESNYGNLTLGLTERMEAIRTMARAQLGKRGPRGKLDKLAAVQLALDFFSQHSDSDPSTDFNNPFRKFAEAFYRAAIGSEIESGKLEHHIRKVLKQRPGG